MSAGKESEPAMDRVEPAGTLDEQAMLAAWLDYHRATLRGKCFGLTDAQLRERSVPPSALSLLGLVRHMTDVERHWFSRFLAEEDSPPLFYSDAEPDGEFTGVDDASVTEAFSAWALQCELSRSALASVESLDVTHQHRDEALSARWVATHMVEEYARHNGHADLLRERIDGLTGE